MSPNNGILVNRVLRFKTLNNYFASFSFKNLDFLLPHAAHFDRNIGLPFLIFNTFESTSLYLFCTLNNMSTCFVMISGWKV